MTEVSSPSILPKIESSGKLDPRRNLTSLDRPLAGSPLKYFNTKPLSPIIEKKKPHLSPLMMNSESRSNFINYQNNMDESNYFNIGSSLSNHKYARRYNRNQSSSRDQLPPLVTL